MQALLQPFQNASLDRLSPADEDILLANIRVLQRAEEARQKGSLLRGKNIGLMCESEDAEEALLFRGAAADLGANVAHIRPSLSELSAPQVLRHTARLLGRLYDAVECQGLSAELVRLVASEASVPVYDGIACAHHLSTRLTRLLGDAGSAADMRRLVLQSVLVSTVLR
jgi:ornithine carbamoyltransferase